MQNDLWKRVQICLRNNAARFEVNDAEAPNRRIEGEYGGETSIRAYTRIWLCMQVTHMPDSILLAELLSLLQQVECEDLRSFRPWFHLLLFREDAPKFLCRKDLVLRCNTSTGSWADLMIKDAAQARTESEDLRVGAVDVENPLRILGQSKMTDLLVFAADLPLEQTKGWAAGLKKRGRRASLLYAALTEAEINVAFEKFSMGSSREEVFTDRSKA